MKKNKREQLFGVSPEELKIIYTLSNNRDYFVTHKSAKKGQSSFRITKDLLENLNETSIKIGKKVKLIISIKDYTLTCELTKSKND